MIDLTTMMWKEVAEFFGNRRFLTIFTISIGLMGVLPLTTGVQGSPVAIILRGMFVLLATLMVVANTAPDLVLHERVGHTLDYLLTTRLPDYAIFGAKVFVSAAVGYIAAMLSLAVQLVATGLFGGTGWHWLFLSLPLGRVVAFGLTADLGLYVAVVGTFVALRVGEQRAAYMVTVVSVGVLLVPFLVGWLHVALTMSWMTQATIAFGVFSIALGLLGLRLFRREMLVLYLQE